MRAVVTVAQGTVAVFCATLVVVIVAVAWSISTVAGVFAAVLALVSLARELSR